MAWKKNRERKRKVKAQTEKSNRKEKVKDSWMKHQTAYLCFLNTTWIQRGNNACQHTRLALLAL